MRVIERIADLRALLDGQRAAGHVVGLVPTMGALHDGHASLVRRAADESDFVAVTVFVNPLQFGENEDFGAYPRSLDSDVERAEAAGASLVFAPPVEEMYPHQVLTTVSVAGLSETLEGAHRPGHFDGVATVVAKLFNIAGACRAYFGEKDWQQLAVVRRMVADLSVPVEVIGCPTVREADGLAMSSRNAYLSADERRAAPVLFRALEAGRRRIEDDAERDAGAVRAAMLDVLEGEPLVVAEYAEVVAADTLTAVNPLAGDVRLLVAARLGRARLIDNLGVKVDPS